MNEILCRQLALDYCCSESDVRDARNHFSPHRLLEGRRRWREETPCFLKIAVVNGKLLFSGEAGILRWCEERYRDAGGAWFFEADTLCAVNARLRADGWQIGTAHPFYIAEGRSDTKPGGLEIRWFDADGIGQFRGDARFGEAFSFCADAPDMLGVAALRGGKFLGMAGASADSPAMWQIGINVEPEARGCGVGTTLVALMKNAILDRGVLPFYGTAQSHIASQRVALGAGFLPAWAELSASRLSEE